MAKKETLPAVIGNYQVMRVEAGALAEVLAENVGGDLTSFDFDKITVPAGGGTAWQVPTLDGVKNMDALEGVIVHFRDNRAYWRESFGESGGNSPPDCSSPDGKIGMGEPGGICARCPLAQFGSADGRRSQACQASRLLFVVTPENLLPIIVKVPPSSLKEVRKYFLRLSTKVIPFSSVVTRLTLTKDKSQDGIVYSKVQAAMVLRLENGEAQRIKAYQTAIRGAIAHNQRVEPDRPAA